MSLQKNLSDDITKLLHAGMSNTQICKELSCSSPTVSYHRKRLRLPKTTAPKVDWPEVQKFYDKEHTIDECCSHFGCSVSGFSRAVRYGLVKTRSISSSQKIRAVKKPRTHSPETKARLRNHMLRRLEDGSYPTLGKSNRAINQPSYAETFFLKVVENDFRDKQVVTEYPCGPYSLDFAWPDKKKCIEVDGEQHYSSLAAIEHDQKRDKYLQSKGWVVYRIRWKEFFRGPQPFIDEADLFIGPLV